MTSLNEMTTPWPLWLHLKDVMALHPPWPAITVWKLLAGLALQLSGELSNEMVHVLNKILAPKLQKSAAVTSVVLIRMRVVTLVSGVGRMFSCARSALF